MADVTTVDDCIDALDEHLQEPGRKLRDILDTELTAADSLMWEDRPTWDGRSTLRIERNDDIDEDLFMGWLRQVQDAEG